MGSWDESPHHWSVKLEVESAAVKEREHFAQCQKREGTEPGRERGDGSETGMAWKRWQEKDCEKARMPGCI